MSVLSNSLWFIVITFVISALAFALMYAIPSAQSPEGFPGLPIWILAVWSPTITAVALALYSGFAQELLRKLIVVEGIGPALLVGLVPLLILVISMVRSDISPDWSRLPFTTLIAMVGLNLFLGPLGEELGWRGYLLPALSERLGWVLASFVIAAIWAIWHTPLWLIDSPQSEIPIAIFFVHVFAYSLMMGAAWALAPHSLVPAVFLHLLFNVMAGLVLILGIETTESWYRSTAIQYLLAAILIVVLVYSGALGPTPGSGRVSKDYTFGGSIEP